MPRAKKDEPGYAEYREQYALCDQSQLVDYSTGDTPDSSTANNVIRARSTRIMFPTIGFPPMSPFQGPRPILETAGGQSALTSGPAPVKRLFRKWSAGKGRVGFPLIGSCR